MRVASLLFVFAASIGLCGCKTSDAKRDVTSSLKHDERTPTAGTETFRWAQTDFNDFMMSSQKAPFRHGQPLPEEHATAKWLQVWSDRIHKLVEQDYLAKNPGPFPAPKPLINVVPSDNENGWVSGIVGCLDFPVDIDVYGEQRPPKHFNKRVRIAYDSLEFPFPRFGVQPQSCSYPTNWPRDSQGKVDPKLFVDFFNTQNAKCKLSFANGRFKITGRECNAGSDGYTSAEKLSVYATSPYIHITSSMVHVIDDQAGILSTLAHELGHYYRTHAIALLSVVDYDYWYIQEFPPQPRKPNPSKDSSEIEKEFQAVMKFPKPVVPGQYYGYGLTDFLLNGLANNLGAMCAERSCACSEFVEFMKNSSDWREKVSCFSCNYVGPEVRANYLKAEALLRSCSPKVLISKEFGVNTLSADALQTSMTNYLYDLKDPIPEGNTLGEVLDVLKRRMDLRIERKNKLTSRIRDEKLGKYTWEQEADDFSVEYLSRLGFDPKLVTKGRLDQYAMRDNSDPLEFTEVNGISMAECLKAFDSDFKKPDGTYLYIPLGDLHSVHHGGCYRAYNMLLESDAHGYRQSFKSVKVEDLNNPTWQDALDAAKAATKDFSSGPTFPGGPLMALPPLESKGLLIIN